MWLLIFACNPAKQYHSLTGKSDLFIARHAALLFYRTVPSTLFAQGVMYSNWRTWTVASWQTYLNLPMIFSLAPSITIFDSTSSFLNSFLAELCACILLDIGYILIHLISFFHIWAYVLPLVDFMEVKYISVNIVVFNLRYQSCRSIVRKRRCKLGCSTFLTPRCVVTLVLRFAVVNHIG